MTMQPDFLTRVFDHLSVTGYPYLGATWVDAIDGADIAVWNDDAQNTAYLVCDEQPGSHTTGLIALLNIGLQEARDLVGAEEWTGGYGVLVIPTTQADRLTEQMIREAQAAEIQIWGFDGAQLTVLFE